MIMRSRPGGRRHHGTSPICLNNEVLPSAGTADSEQNLCSGLYPPFGEREKKTHLDVFGMLS